MQESLRIPINAGKECCWKHTFELMKEAAIAASDVEDPHMFLGRVPSDEGCDQSSFHDGPEMPVFCGVEGLERIK